MKSAPPWNHLDKPIRWRDFVKPEVRTRRDAVVTSSPKLRHLIRGQVVRRMTSPASPPCRRVSLAPPPAQPATRATGVPQRQVGRSRPRRRALQQQCPLHPTVRSRWVHYSQSSIAKCRTVAPYRGCDSATGIVGICRVCRIAVRH